MFIELTCAFVYVAFIYTRNRLPIPKEIVFGINAGLVFMVLFSALLFLDPFSDISPYYYGGVFFGFFLFRNTHPFLMSSFRICLFFAIIYVLSYFIALKAIGMILFFIPTYHLLKV